MDVLKSEKTTTNALVYLRVSTEDQVENYSLQTQEGACRQEAQRRGLHVVRIFREEGKSAKTIQGRPILLELLDVCRKRQKYIAAIIVHRLDRLSRKTEDYLVLRHTLSRYKIGIISVSEPTGTSPMETFVETLFASIAQLDNEVRSQRSTQGMHARFLAGLPNSGVPLGYLTHSGQVIEDATRYGFIRTAWNQIETGRVTPVQVLRWLNDQGVRTKDGRPLRLQTLLGIFRNKFYAGFIVSKKHNQEVKGKYQAMISEETYYRVQLILDRNGRKSHRHGTRLAIHPDFPFRRLVRCAYCHYAMSGSWSKGKRRYYAFYFCSSRCRDGVYVRAGVMNDATAALFDNLRMSKWAVRFVSRFIRTTHLDRCLSVRSRQAALTQQIDQVAKFRQTLIEQHIAGELTLEIFQEQTKLLDERMQTITLAKDIALTSQYNVHEILRFLGEKLADLPVTYAASTLQQKHVLIRGFFSQQLQWSATGYVEPVVHRFFQILQSARADTDLSKQFPNESFEELLYWLDRIRKDYYELKG